MSGTKNNHIFLNGRACHDPKSIRSDSYIHDTDYRYFVEILLVDNLTFQEDPFGWCSRDNYCTAMLLMQEFRGL